jgi:acetylornithine deacetylase/succinyl-diaminopimelate desuccinylase-like protein
LTEVFYKPTLNIDGLWSGYTVEKGVKTIVPDEAGAKVDMRLVLGQNVDAIFENLKRHLADHGFGDVGVEKLGFVLPAYRVDPDERIARVIAGAVKKSAGKTITLPTMPGSGAMVWLPIILGKPMGFAGSGAAYMDHRPNEFITRQQYLKGVKLFATIYDDFGKA